MFVALLLLLGGQAPSEPPPLFDLLEQVQRRLHASDRAGARKELTEALRLYPDSPAVHNFLGVLEAEEGAFVKAEARFREAIRRAPRYTDAYLNLGRLYQENAARDGEAVRKALEAYQSVLAIAPAHSEAAYQSAALLQALGEFGRSLDHLNLLPPVSQERAQVLALRCADHVGRGERAEADRAAEGLLRRPELAQADVRSILPTLTAHGRPDLAQVLVEALRARGLASLDDLLLLGRLQEDSGDFDGARKALEEAAAARPDSVDVLTRLARVAHKKKDFKGALGYLAHARSLEPGNASVRFFFGMVCVNLDLGVEAYDSLKEAVRLEPENAAFNYALGAVALQRREPAEAIPYFRKYAELKPADTRAGFALGIAAFKSGDFAGARAELAKSAQEADTAAAANYFLARMAREENDLEGALGFAQKAVLANPRYAEPYAELGLLYIRRREPVPAAEALAKCLELDPDNYLGNYHLLLLYERTKDGRRPEQARRFEELQRRRDQKGDEFLRLIEVRPY
jgi:tetratricopeptide (TPR) repeat protein